MSEPVAPGRVLGDRYRLASLIARGGMATVWEGEDPLLSRRVAIKILDRQLAHDEALRARFRHEAVAAARLAHPNIVATYDTGEDDGDAYIVMELVDGMTLRELLDTQGTLAIAQAVDIAMQVAAALSHAHDNGLVHRDVKPGNVLIQPDGQVKVTDFGIAKAADSGQDLTRAGTVMGTARYLAPEQVRDGTVDARADVYSLALVLYELLVGQAPFAADSDVATAVARLTNDPPSVRTARPEVPPALDLVIAAALVREPEHRTGTARAFRDALAATIGAAEAPPAADLTRPIAVPPPVPPAVALTAPSAPRRRSRVLIALGLIVIFAVGAAIGYLGFRALDDGATATTAATTPDPEPVPVVIETVAAFDPLGTNGENDGDAEHVIMPEESAAGWSTERYATANLSGKAGVGLVFTLASSQNVGELTILADARPWSAEVYLSDQEFEGEPTGVAAAADINLGQNATLTLESPRSARFVLLWITELPRTGSDPNPFRLTINQVELFG